MDLLHNVGMRDRALLFKRAVTEGFAATVAQGFLATFTRLRQCSSFLVSRCKHALHYEIFLSRTSTATSCSPQPWHLLFIISTRSARLPHSHFVLFFGSFLFVKTGGYMLPNIWGSIIWLRAFYPRFPQRIDKVVIVVLSISCALGLWTPGGGGLLQPLITPELCIRWLCRHVPHIAPGHTKPALIEKQMLSAVVGCFTCQTSDVGWGLNRRAGFSKIKREERKGSISCRGYFAQRGRCCLFDI